MSKFFISISLFLAVVTSCTKDQNIPIPFKDQNSTSYSSNKGENTPSFPCILGKWEEEVSPGLSGTNTTYWFTVDSVFILTSSWGDVMTFDENLEPIFSTYNTYQKGVYKLIDDQLLTRTTITDSSFKEQHSETTMETKSYQKLDFNTIKIDKATFKKTYPEIIIF